MEEKKFKLDEEWMDMPKSVKTFGALLNDINDQLKERGRILLGVLHGEISVTREETEAWEKRPVGEKPQKLLQLGGEAAGNGYLALGGALGQKSARGERHLNLKTVRGGVSALAGQNLAFSGGRFAVDGARDVPAGVDLRLIG